MKYRNKCRNAKRKPAPSFGKPGTSEFGDLISLEEMKEMQVKMAELLHLMVDTCLALSINYDKSQN